MNFKTNRWWMLLIPAFLFIACRKEIKAPESEPISAAAKSHGHLQQTKTFSSDVVVRWLDIELDILRLPLPAGTTVPAAERPSAYCGIALYEAVVNGMPSYQSLTGQLTDFPAMPFTESGKAYHWAASANAALAEMNRKLFSGTSDANKAKMNNLESELQASYSTVVDNATLQRSIAYGKEVARRVYAWAATDGSANVNPPYIPPVGPGLWVPTQPVPPANPYVNQRRLLVPNVSAGTALAPPPDFSTDPGSAYHSMVKEVYDISQSLTQEQKNLALYFRDAGAPGYYGGAGHYVSILSQIIGQSAPSLDIAALAYVKSGIGLSDALVLCFTYKYTFNVLRPVTYIRNVMGYSSWSPLFDTPNHPEFPSAHSANGGGFLTMLSDVFGEDYEFTDKTYQYLNLPNPTFHSFSELKKAVGESRVFAGIHYKPSCEKGVRLGEKVAQNALAKLKFRKE